MERKRPADQIIALEIENGKTIMQLLNRYGSHEFQVAHISLFLVNCSSA